MSNPTTPAPKAVDYGKYISAGLAAWIYRGDGNGLKDLPIAQGFTQPIKSSDTKYTENGLNAAITSRENPLTGKMDVFVTFAGTAFEKASAPNKNPDGTPNKDAADAFKDGVANYEGLTGVRIQQTVDAGNFVKDHFGQALQQESITPDNIGHIYVTGHSLGTTDALAGAAAVNKYFRETEGLDASDKITLNAFSIPVYFGDQVVYHKDDLEGINVNITYNNEDPAHDGLIRGALDNVFAGTRVRALDVDDTIIGKSPSIPGLVDLAKELMPVAAFLVQKDNHDAGSLSLEIENRYLASDEGRLYQEKVAQDANYQAQWEEWRGKTLEGYKPENSSITNMLSNLQQIAQTTAGQNFLAYAIGVGWNSLNLGQRVAVQTAVEQGFASNGLWRFIDSNGVPLSSSGSNGISYAQYIVDRIRNGQGLPDDVIDPRDGISKINTKGNSSGQNNNDTVIGGSESGVISVGTPISTGYSSLTAAQKAALTPQRLKELLEAATEPRRVCRRLQLLRKLSHYEQDHEQVFP